MYSLALNPSIQYAVHSDQAAHGETKQVGNGTKSLELVKILSVKVGMLLYVRMMTMSRVGVVRLVMSWQATKASS